MINICHLNLIAFSIIGSSSFLLLVQCIDAFTPQFTTPIRPLSRRSTTNLYGGIGIAKTYSWKEEQYEIELRVKVPKETTAKQIKYTPRSKSIHLAVGDEVLLDGSREMRGLIDLDGTFWSIVDSEEHDGRDVVITMEKMILPPKDPFEVVEFDWNGIYPDDDDEILEKRYDVPEVLDVREYAASLGVDIDNINMTLVDKNMFSSGLNMTRSTLDELTKAGYVKEVTRQGDGLEMIDEGAGKTVPFNALGDNIGKDEMEDAGIQLGGSTTSTMQKGRNPSFMKKDSPWLQTMPVEEARTGDAEIAEEADNNTSLSQEGENKSGKKARMSDPIDLLTVSKLKEVLKREGLKVSGTKAELQERLKEHVKSVLKKNNENENATWQ